MKHIKKFNEGLFSDNTPKEGDSFAKQLLKVIEEDNIEINSLSGDRGIFFELDNKMYHIERMEMFPFVYKYFVDIDGKSVKRRLPISKYLFDQAMDMYMKKISNHGELPNISDEVRAANKYNL